ncbi:MAG TPA: gamma carbonic anhydrase family protein [Roseiarcus sp.]|nr:gamma carbonic anhydrase family protein [Roseiarcus sp.]
MPTYSLDGRRPTLPPEGKFWIAPTASLIGDVRLAEDVGVWFGAVLRGDNEPIVIGARTNVQDQCVMHTDMEFPLEIGEDCTVGHHAILHGCTIGRGTLVGMGAVVLNGAKIGSECLIGARALITERKVFPDRSLIVGSPAKAVRDLDAAEVESLRESSRGYVRNWRRYAAGLMPLDDSALKARAAD